MVSTVWTQLATQTDSATLEVAVLDAIRQGDIPPLPGRIEELLSRWHAGRGYAGTKREFQGTVSRWDMHASADRLAASIPEDVFVQQVDQAVNAAWCELGVASVRLADLHHPAYEYAPAVIASEKPVVFPWAFPNGDEFIQVATPDLGAGIGSSFWTGELLVWGERLVRLLNASFSDLGVIRISE